MSDLKTCEWDHRVLTTPDVMKASAIVVKAGCFPARLVIRSQEKPTGMEYVVHTELLRVDPSPERDHLTIALKHEGFQQGNYCSSWERAVEVYNERLAGLL